MMIEDYMKQINSAIETVDKRELELVLKSLTFCATSRIPILAIGNGGSAAIAHRWSCDHSKGVNEDTKMLANVTNLASNMSLMTAIANDTGYQEVFSKQIRYFQSPGALVLAISSSGNSPNIIEEIGRAHV